MTITIAPKKIGNFQKLPIIEGFAFADSLI